MDRYSTLQEFVNAFVEDVKDEPDFPFSYWRNVAINARLHMSGVCRVESPQKNTAATGFPPTEYGMARIYPKGVEPNFSPHSEDRNFRALPPAEMFDSDGCYEAPQPVREALPCRSHMTPEYAG